jgi:hypothetical protein
VIIIWMKSCGVSDSRPEVLELELLLLLEEPVDEFEASEPSVLMAELLIVFSISVWK